MLKIGIIAGLLALFYACIQPFDKYQNSNHQKEVIGNNTELVGIWYSVRDSFQKIEFTTDGYFNIYSKREGKKEFKFLMNKNGQFVEEDYGNMKYHVNKNGDTLHVVLTGEKNNAFYAKRTFFIDGDCLTEIVYKEGIDNQGIDISNYIQVANGYQKSKTKILCEIDAPRFVFKLPKDFTPKTVFMAFGQPDGVIGKINQQENSITYDVPNEHIMKIKERENVKVFTWKLLDFYIDTETGKSKKIKVLYTEDVNDFKERGSKEQITLDYDINQLVVLANSRFNPDTETIYKYFGEQIKGNVLSFEVVNLRTQLENWNIDLNNIKYIK